MTQQANAAIKRHEAIVLAKRFAKETAQSRDHALKLIMARHAALLGSRARQKANKGPNGGMSSSGFAARHLTKLAATS